MSREFMSHGKQKVKMKDACKKGSHEWGVSKWLNKGIHQGATEFYCKFCLLTVDMLEKDYLASLSLKEQPNLPQEQGM